MKTRGLAKTASVATAGLPLRLGACLILLTVGPELSGAIANTHPTVKFTRAASWQEPIPGLSERIIADYQAPAYRWSSGHRGVDASVEPGAEIHSPVKGVVHFAGWVVNRGVISIADDTGLIASFEPVCPLAKRGETVAAGQIIATHCIADDDEKKSGEDYGHCSTDCLHFSARENGEYLSPLHLIYGLQPSRLWPVKAL